MKSFKRIAAYFIICMIFSQLFAIQCYAEEKAASDGFEKIAQSARLSLYLKEETGEFYIKDDISGKIWYSNPPKRDHDPKARNNEKMVMSSNIIAALYEEASDTTSTVDSYSGSSKKGGMTINKIKDGFRVTYDFSDQGITIPLEITLQDEYFTARILFDGISEKASFKVLTVDLLPFLGAAGPNEKGYLFVPDGSGAIINFNNGRYTYKNYQAHIYGDDESFVKVYKTSKNEDVKLPVYGINKEDCGLLAIVHDGATSGIINGSVGGLRNSYNRVYSSFEVRRKQQYTYAADENHNTTKNYVEKRIKGQNAEVRYYPLDGKENSTYSGMALKYKDYLIQEKGMKRINSEKVPLYIDLLGGITKTKNILGIPFNSYVPLTTFTQLNDIAKEIKALGINDMVIKYSGWNKDQIAEKPVISANFSGMLGNKASLAQTINYFNNNGIQFYPAVDMIRYSKNGNGINRNFDSAKTLIRTPVLQYQYLLNYGMFDDKVAPWYFISPSFIAKRVDTFLRSFKRIKEFNGVSGIALEGMSSGLYSDFSKNQYNMKMTMNVFNQAVGEIKQQTGNVMGDSACEFSLPYLSAIEDAPVWSSGYDIEDEAVPFYQIAVRGLVESYSVPPVNMASNQRNLFLRAVETGSMLHYSWVYGDTSELVDSVKYNYLYGADYRQWLSDCKVQYKEISEINKKTGNLLITNHYKLEPGVYVTEYENNVKTVVNYNDSEKYCFNRKVDANGYILIEGGN